MKSWPHEGDNFQFERIIKANVEHDLVFDTTLC